MKANYEYIERLNIELQGDEIDCFIKIVDRLVSEQSKIGFKRRRVSSPEMELLNRFKEVADKLKNKSE